MRIVQPALDNPVVGRGYPAFLDELKTSGFVAGQNLTIEIVRTDQDTRGLFAETADLVRSNVELLVVEGNETALQAAMEASPTIPIVLWANNFDPIARGYVASLSRPGGDITGVVFQQLDLAQKQVEVLAQSLPGRSRLAVLFDVQSADQFVAAERAAKALNMQVQPLKLENPPYDFDAAFRNAAAGSAQMALVLSSPLFAQQTPRITELAIAQRLPAMFIFKTYVEAGGLMSYGVDFPVMFRRAADDVVKILNGTRPADIPIEQADKFEFAVNLKTAKAIGVELPMTLLARADTVIE